MVENPKFCTHLVAQSFSRTMKFFVAINVCHYIVTKQWVEESFQSNKFLSKLYRSTIHLAENHSHLNTLFTCVVC